MSEIPTREAEEIATAVTAARVAERKANAELKARQEHPDRYIGVVQIDGAIQYFPCEPNRMRSRTQSVNGIDVEHTYDDADGVWIYRHMR